MIPMRRIYVCSPLRGDIEANIERAKRLCHAVILAGHAPFASHVHYTAFLDDRIEAERKAGAAAGVAFLAVCHEVWVYADNLEGCTPGMRAEIANAMQHYTTKIVYRPPEWAGL